MKHPVLPKYRKFHSSIWTNFEFASLDNDSKLAWIYIFTHPNMTALGAMRGSLTGISEEISVKKIKIDALRDRHLIHYCPTTSTIYIPHFIEHQSPQSPKCVTSWEKSLPYIPDGPLKKECVIEAMTYVEKMAIAYRIALAKAFAKAYLNDLTIDYVKAYAKDYAIGYEKGYAIANAIQERREKREVNTNQVI